MRADKFRALIPAFILMGAFVVPLFGHVSINPSTVQAGIRHLRLFVRAPVEKEIPVVELGIEVSPEWRENGGDLGFSEDISGWMSHRELDEDGKVLRLWWTGDGAEPETFQMIYFTLTIPEKPGVYPFKSWQKYSDGSVVWWNEPQGEGVQNPYPIVTVERPPILTAGGVVQVGATTIALLALAISLLSVRNNRKNHV